MFLLVLLTAAACAPEADESAAQATSDVQQSSTDLQLFSLPRRGASEWVVAAEAPRKRARPGRARREYAFPDGAREAEVSASGKAMCFVHEAWVHCAVLGTNTGFYYDATNNVVQALPALPLQTPDGEFVKTFVKNHRDSCGGARRATLAGHSQGAADVAQIFFEPGLLRDGDQVVLLQPTNAALRKANARIDAAARRGVRVVASYSFGDIASAPFRSPAGAQDYGWIVRTDEKNSGEAVWYVHNTPRARDRLLQKTRLREPSEFAGITINLALDALILANPDSRCDGCSWVCPRWPGEAPVVPRCPSASATIVNEEF